MPYSKEPISSDIIQWINTLFSMKRGGNYVWGWFIMFKYGGTQIISTLEESLQKSNIICTTAQSVWSLGHGKNILLRNHTKFSTVLFTTTNIFKAVATFLSHIFLGLWPHKQRCFGERTTNHSISIFHWTESSLHAGKTHSHTCTESCVARWGSIAKHQHLLSF